MKSARALLAIIVMIFLSPTMALGKAMVYEGEPLKVYVPLGGDLTLQFDEPQAAGVDSRTAQYITVEPAGNYVLLSGLKTSNSQRLLLKGVNTGKLTILTLSVVEGYEGANKLTILRSEGVAPSKKGNGRGEKKGKPISLNDRAKIVIRYINQLAGPVSAMESTPFPVSHSRQELLGRELKGFYRKGELKARVVDVLVGGGLTAVVVEAVNVTPKAVLVNPLSIRGKWHSVQPWKTRLEPGEAGAIICVVDGRVDLEMFLAMEAL